MNNVYDDARVKLLTALFDWTAYDLRLVAWSGTPSFLPTEKTVSQITGRGYAISGTSQVITSKTVSVNGTAQTNQLLLPAVPVGPPVTWFTMTKAGTDLILYIDDAEGLPFTPNGLDVPVTPDWLSNRGWWRP